LALANKEQRGYITPLEFNLMANQAQQLIFEQYFYDLNQAKRGESDTTSFSDMEELIENKLTEFTTIAGVTGGNTFPTNYRVGKIFAGNFEARKVGYQEFANITQSRFHGTGLSKNPIYRESRASGEDIEVFNGSTLTTGITCEIVQKPLKAEWGYDVIAEKALYNASRSTNFQLHESEETELVFKILESAGIIINKPGLAQVAAQEDIKKIQQEKA
jgi:hypothetical protein